MKLPAFFGRITYFITYPIILLILGGSTRVYVVVTYKGSLLLTQNFLGNQRKWRLPGGGSRNGEPIVDVAVRELREEIGLEVKPADLKLLTQNPLRSERRYNYFLFLCELPDEPILKVDSVEILRARFMPISDLKNIELSEEAAAGLRFVNSV